MAAASGGPPKMTMMTRLQFGISGVLVGTVGALCVLITAAQPGPSGVFTAEQASAGRSAYQANCASCHLPDLSGRNEAPQLSGSNFMNTWAGRPAGALAAYIQGSMPPGNTGSLSREASASIVAFILQ